MTNRQGSPEDMEDLDPGLARERTELAWTRTAVSFAALGGAILKMAPAIGIPVLAASALIWGLGRLARRSERATVPALRRRLFLIAAAVTLVSLAALALALLSNSSPFPAR